jgi:AraC-like DNA-binding protein
MTDGSGPSAIVSDQAWTREPDVNTIALAFALNALLRGAGRGAAEPGEAERAPRWIDSFRRVLAECLDDQALLLSVAARRMAISPRTLQRLLKWEGTTWRVEVDAARRAKAARLQRAGLSTSQIARRLGYSDARALRRAARRWERAARPMTQPPSGRATGCQRISGAC